MTRISCRAALLVALPLLLALLPLGRALAAGPPSKLFHGGFRWIGQARKCAPMSGWRVESLFPAPAPAAADGLCVYTWLAMPARPSPAHLADLFSGSGASVLVEDVPVVVPMTPAMPWSPAEVSFLAAQRSAFLQHVGTASLLRYVWPNHKVARIVVIDAAPTARDGSILLGGGSRHGDTLAHLIEDIVCDQLPNNTRRCAAEVTSELALPWLGPGLSTADGGYSGTPLDLARAIMSATRRWQSDLASNPGATPERLILNFSVGWEHTPGIADCFDDPSQPVDLPARAVQLALKYAFDSGALIIAAAGNDSGGPAPRTGLVCPGSYQGLEVAAGTDKYLLTAVSGVDFADRPLESARLQGRTPLVGLAFAGVAWSPQDAAPPSLVGSSVATAVVAAVSGLVWAVKPSLSALAVIEHVRDGGVAVAGAPDACPPNLPHCSTRRASVCGAVQAAGLSLGCTAAPPKPWSSPALPAQIAALDGSVSPTLRAAAVAPLSQDRRFFLPSMQVEPWTFPMPISATCPTCYVADSTLTSPDQLTIPALGRPLHEPMLLLHLDDNSWVGVELQGPLAEHVPYRFNLPPLPPVQSAYLSGLDWQEQHSIVEQLFVHR